MRLIDADEFKRQIAGMAIVNNYSADKANKICELIDHQPTAYDVDKVVEELERQKDQCFRRSGEIEDRFGENYESQKYYGKACSYDYAIKIVKSGGI